MQKPIFYQDEEKRPTCTGGYPLASSKDGVMFNDILGNTLGAKSGDKYNAVTMTAFGETSDESAFFTGKPQIGELGYAFLFRNYRPDNGKWQTSDPLGYPDGWNNFAYCCNYPSYAIDLSGLWTLQIGFTCTGGGGVGGTVSFGIVIGYSAANGFTAGFYQTTGGGASVGAGGSVSGTVTVSGAGAIDSLAGTAATIGGSGGQGIVIGGEANIPTSITNMGNTSFDFSIGFGGGTPAEQHTFVTQTFIQQIIGNGGSITSIKE